MRREEAFEPEPAISVVIAARDEEQFIGRCLQAVRQQDFQLPYEVIVVDNASNDSTAAVAKSFDCRVIDEPTPGQLFAKQVGVLAARGEIVAVLDADCAPASHWLSSIYQAMTDSRDTNLAAVTCCYHFQGLPWWGSLYVTFVRHCLVGAYRLFLPTMPFVIGGNVAFRRSCFHGGYPQAGGIAQTELGLAKVLNKSGEIGYVPAMKVDSSGRRFEPGAIYFFFRYKLIDYFAEYLAELLTGKDKVRLRMAVNDNQRRP